MTHLYETAVIELEDAKIELVEIEAMTDEQACYIYKVDSKAEIIRIMNEEIESLEREASYLAPMIYEPEYAY